MDDVWVTSVIMHTHFAANCLLYCYWWLHFQKKWFQEDYYLRPFLSIERKGGEKSPGFYQNSSQDFCMRCDWLMSHLRPKVGIVDKRSLKVLNDDCIQQLQPPTPPPPLFFLCRNPVPKKPNWNAVNSRLEERKDLLPNAHVDKFNQKCKNFVCNGVFQNSVLLQGAYKGVNIILSPCTTNFLHTSFFLTLTSSKKLCT